MGGAVDLSGGVWGLHLLLSDEPLAAVFCAGDPRGIVGSWAPHLLPALRSRPRHLPPCDLGMECLLFLHLLLLGKGVVWACVQTRGPICRRRRRGPAGSAGTGVQRPPQSATRPAARGGRGGGWLPGMVSRTTWTWLLERRLGGS